MASIRRRALLGTGAAFAAWPRRTRAADRPIRIGVLTDMTGPYAANTGLGSVLGAQMAVEDFMRANPSVRAEVVQADLQLKPDVAVSIARDWFDNQDVDVVTDVPLSSAAFAIGDLVKQKDKLAIFTGGASADITGAHCGPNHLHWVYDTLFRAFDRLSEPPPSSTETAPVETGEPTGEPAPEETSATGTES